MDKTKSARLYAGLIFYPLISLPGLRGGGGAFVKAEG